MVKHLPIRRRNKKAPLPVWVIGLVIFLYWIVLGIVLAGCVLFVFKVTG